MVQIIDDTVDQYPGFVTFRGSTCFSARLKLNTRQPLRSNLWTFNGGKLPIPFYMEQMHVIPSK